MLATHLRLLREKNGLTQKQVAEMLNIDRSTYAYYESGKTRPDILTIAKLARLYRISTDFLLDVRIPSLQMELHDERVDYQSFQTARAQYLSDLSRDEQNLILYYRQLENKSDAFMRLQTLYEEEQATRAQEEQAFLATMGEQLKEEPED
ncbi:MAG: helix-turn-helix transcriptional regulator [Clostridiales bacterium]|nr:helix-turn-helix transcriptional regulator [Clostridiales bacterium]